MIQDQLVIHTQKKRQIIDLTDQVNDFIKSHKAEDGLCHLFINHTTAVLTVGEMEEGIVQDFLEFAEKIIPRMQFRHSHKPNHAPDHMLGALIGPSLTVPISSGKLALGTWQRVMLVELDGPRERTVSLTL